MSLTPRLDRLEKNLIINGNFDFWQRGTSFPAAISGNYNVDRFRYAKGTSTSVHTVARDTDVPNLQSNYSLLVDCTTADAALDAGSSIIISQRIEGNIFRKLAGKTFTLSFWVKATVTGTYSVSFRNEAGDRSYVAEYTVDAADTWEKKSITITHDTSGTWNYGDGSGIRINWSLGAGSTFQTTPNSWQSGNFTASNNQVNAADNIANNFRLSQIMLIEGDVAPEDFVYAGRDYAEELQLCQRYFEKSYSQAFAPGANNGIGNWQYRTGFARDQYVPVATFAVTKASIPTMTAYNRNGPQGNWSGITPSFTASTAGVHVLLPGAANNQIIQGHWTADAEI